MTTAEKYLALGSASGAEAVRVTDAECVLLKWPGTQFSEPFPLLTLEPGRTGFSPVHDLIRCLGLLAADHADSDVEIACRKLERVLRRGERDGVPKVAETLSAALAAPSVRKQYASSDYAERPLTFAQCRLLLDCIYDRVVLQPESLNKCQGMLS